MNGDADRLRCEAKAHWRSLEVGARLADMKTCRGLVSAVVIMISLWAFAGCAHNQESVTSTNTNSASKTYNSQDLNRTGKRTTGEALQAADPSVTATSGR